MNIDGNFSEDRSVVTHQSGVDFSAGGEHSERTRVNVIDRQHVELRRRELEHAVLVSVDPDPEIRQSKISIVDLPSFNGAPIQCLNGIDRLPGNKLGQFINGIAVSIIEVTINRDDEFQTADHLQIILAVIDERIDANRDKTQIPETLLSQNCQRL